MKSRIAALGILLVVIAGGARAQEPTPRELQTDERQTFRCNYLTKITSMSHQVFLLAGNDEDPQDLVTATGIAGSGQNASQLAVFQVDPQPGDNGNLYQVHITSVIAPVTPFAGTTPTPDVRDCDWKISIKDKRFQTPTPTAAP